MTCLREAKKMRKELRASLEDARTRVAELETQNLDAKFEIDVNISIMSLFLMVLLTTFRK
jgi:hypothetical protein